MIVHSSRVRSAEVAIELANVGVSNGGNIANTEQYHLMMLRGRQVPYLEIIYRLATAVNCQFTIGVGFILHNSYRFA